ncbi:MAG: glycosyltransferase [Lachnospiraceae bacterium]|nr:glycosyltransferase [Lachnospiraceae bacterium]
MTILFYRYGSICEPGIMNAFRSLDITVREETAEMTDKNIAPSKCVEIVSRALKETRPVFVFSVNFFPAVAQVCHIYGILYLCWTVDSPVFELFSKAIQYDTNRIFMFDRAQYEYFRPFNPDCIFHLPLASWVEQFDTVTSEVSASDRIIYGSDISFVGSLYIEKNPMHAVKGLPEYINGFIDGIVDASLKLYGYNLIEETVTDEIVSHILNADADAFSFTDTVTDPGRYVIAHHYLGMQAAEVERIRTLNRLAEEFEVDLYTRSDSARLHNVHVHDGIQTLTQMPKVFRLSKINLNMTVRPIQTGIPLRIFDILGCGGFLMTNYQPELLEHFEIGVDLEVYTELDELLEKCSYYLTHEEERKQIARNGYRKVKENHTYQKRLTQMLRIATE